MNITELLTFKAVVEKKGFSKAGEYLGYSQSTVTKQIKRLEESVGFELFARGWKSTLTKQGELFYQDVDSLLDHWKSVSIRSQEIEEELVGEIGIGIIEPLEREYLPKIIDWLRQYRPKMNAVFELGNTKRLCELVGDNQLDCAICGEDAERSHELEFKKVSTDEIVLVALKTHELLMKEIIELEEVLNYPLIYGDKTCLSHQKFVEVLGKRNLIDKLGTHYICSNQRLIMDVLDTIQIGIVPKTLALESKNKVSVLPISDEEFKVVYGLVTKKKDYNYLEKTIQEIKNMITNETKK